MCLLSLVVGSLSSLGFLWWPNDVLAFAITVKEAIALPNALESFKLSIKDSRVDLYVDSLALFRSWNGQSAKSHGLA